MTLSPLELVGIICLVIGLNIGCFYGLDAMTRNLAEPRRPLALGGGILAFLLAAAVDTAIALRADHQAANFAFLGLLPSLAMMRAANRSSPRGLQFGLLGLALVSAAVIVAILLKSLAQGPQNGWTWALMALFIALPLAFAGMTLQRILGKGGAA
ncbi:MAG: hypothetical protein KF842_11435 [Caulobacter sp.]|nr:hypothetical protein [Caulobacter sp.]